MKVLTSFRSALALLFIAVVFTCPAQTKKEVIATQSAALDSILALAEKQHDAIVAATARIEDLQDHVTELDKRLARQQSEKDTLQKELLAQKDLLRTSRLLRPVFGTPSRDMDHGVIERREAHVLFSSLDRYDLIVIETKGTELLTGITTLRILDADERLLHEQEVETTSLDELDQADDLQRCIVSRRLSEMCAPGSFVPVARSRSGEWQALSLDIATVIPNAQLGFRFMEKPDDPRPVLLVFDKEAGRVVRTW